MQVRGVESPECLNSSQTKLSRHQYLSESVVDHERNLYPLCEFRCDMPGVLVSAQITSLRAALAFIRPLHEP